MASKRRRARTTARAANAAPPQPQSQGPTIHVGAVSGTLRLAALLSATCVALLVYELLQNPIGFWPALGAAFVAGILARAALVWLERVWLRAAARRARRLEARRAEQSKRAGE